MIVETKLHVPQTKGQLITRPHLFQHLEKGIDTKLTLVTAPAGYGKSTLLSEWAKTLNVDIAWLSLDGNDNNPIRFWKHTIESLKQNSSLFAKQSARHLGDEEQDSTGMLSVIKLINQLNRLPEKIVLIWDDFHCVTDELLLEGVAYFLEHLPKALHICIASRRQPPLSFSRMRVNGTLNELNVESLRFNLEESTTFLTNCTDLVFREDECTIIHKQTEGWIAGMRLVALSRSHVTKDSPKIINEEMTGKQQDISDYFFEEVMMKLSAEMQQFLLKTSILNRMSLELVNEVTHLPESYHLLQQLEQENLFLISLDNNRTWYRYHHLFQGFLQKKLSEMMPDMLQVLHKRAGSWFEENAYLNEAMEHYLAGRQFTKAIQLLEKIAPAMVHSEIGSLRRWFEMIPDSMLAKHPRLLMNDIFSLFMLGEVEMGQAKLEYVLEGLPTSIVELDIYRSGFEMLQVIGALFANNFELFVQLSEDYVKMYPEGDNFISLGTEGDLQFPKWSFLEMVGNLQEREQLLHRLLACWSRTKHYYLIGSLCIGYGELMYEWNRLDEAEKYLQRARQLGETHQNMIAITLSSLLLSKVCAAEGQRERADEILQVLHAELNKDHFPKIYQFVQVYQTHLLLLRGEEADAIQRWADYDLQITDKIPNTMLFEYNIFASLLVKRGRKEDAHRLIIRLTQVAHRSERQSDYITLLAKQSIFLADKGENTKSLDILEEALSLAETNGYKRTLIDLGKPLMHILQVYLEARQKQHRRQIHMVDLAYVKDLLRFKDISHGTKVNTARAIVGNIYLTEKELLVLHLLTTSLANKQIADELNVSISTAKTHIKNIYSKLKVSSRLEAIERAKQLDFL